MREEKFTGRGSQAWHTFCSDSVLLRVAHCHLLVRSGIVPRHKTTALLDIYAGTQQMNLLLCLPAAGSAARCLCGGNKVLLLWPWLGRLPYRMPLCLHSSLPAPENTQQKGTERPFPPSKLKAILSSVLGSCSILTHATRGQKSLSCPVSPRCIPHLPGSHLAAVQVIRQTGTRDLRFTQ